MSAPRLALLLATAVLASPSASGADVHVVDAALGPGADFATIVDASLAAADGDVLLVRPGAYTGMLLQGKGLSVFGDTGGVVQVTGITAVNAQAPSQPTVLRKLQFAGDLFTPGILDLQDAAGAIWIEQCEAGRIAMNSCDAVTLARTDVALDEGNALSAFDSRLAAFDVEAQAGAGSPGGIDGKTMESFPGGTGGHGLRDAGSNEILVSGCTLSGGDGGPGAEPSPAGPCSDGGDGGSGLALLTADSIVRRQQTTLVAGAGGPGGTGCRDGEAGAPLLLGTPRTPPPIDLPGSARVVRGSSPVREGETLTITLEGGPGDTVLLLWSLEQGYELLPGLNGVLLLGAPISVVPATFVLPPSGVLPLSATVPELGGGVEGVPLFVSAGFVDAAGTRLLGSGTAVLLLDAAF